MNVAAGWARELIRAGVGVHRLDDGRPGFSNTHGLDADLRALLGSSAPIAERVAAALERLCVDPTPPPDSTHADAMLVIGQAGIRAWVCRTKRAARAVRREAALNGEIILSVGELLDVVPPNATLTVLGRRSFPVRKRP